MKLELLKELLTEDLGESETVLNGYLEAAVFADLPEEHSGSTDFNSEAVNVAREDVERFLTLAGDDLGNALSQTPLNSHDFWTGVGHDLWLTRNGHGAGFWDKPEVYGDTIAPRLTKSAESMGHSDLYVGDDGDLHLS